MTKKKIVSRIGYTHPYTYCTSISRGFYSLEVKYRVVLCGYCGSWCYAMRNSPYSPMSRTLEATTVTAPLASVGSPLVNKPHGDVDAHIFYSSYSSTSPATTDSDFTCFVASTVGGCLCFLTKSTLSLPCYGLHCLSYGEHYISVALCPSIRRHTLQCIIVHVLQCIFSHSSIFHSHSNFPRCNTLLSR